MRAVTINSLKDLKDAQKNFDKLFLLVYKGGAEQSECALSRIKGNEEENEIPLVKIDVNEIKDIHPEFGITTAPSLLEFNKGILSNIYKGCQTEDFYKAVLSGSGFSSAHSADGKALKRVTVYTTPTCTWCNTLKTYLREQHIQFTEVDVASNPSKAQEMVRRSGQQGVPQTDINGQMIIGFDKAKINELLEIR